MRPWTVRRLFGFATRSAAEVRRDIDDEIAFHLEMRAGELMEEGFSEADARAQAAREFGERDAGQRALEAIDRPLERRRVVRQLAAEFRQDLAIGLRLLGRNPGFAAVAVLTLALGLGANTAIYSVLDAVLFRALPYPQPEQLVVVFETLENGSLNSVSGGVFEDWRRGSTRFQGLTLLNDVTRNLRQGGATERVAGVETSHELTRVLGVTPLLGRGFLPDEERPGGPNAVVMLTEEFWRSQFGGDPGIVGRPIVLDEVPHTVVGVLPAGSWIFRDHDFFIPAVRQPGTPRASRSMHGFMVLGRLAQGVTPAEADAELKALRVRLLPEYPEYKRGWGFAVRPAAEVVGGGTRTPLLILLGAVSLVLLVACANVANLLLARSLARRQELAVRAALGASGGRIVRQILTENLVLAIAGGAAGIAVAHAGLAVLQAATADLLPVTFTPRLDHRVLAVSLLVAIVTGPLVGLLPALRARRLDLNVALADGGRGSSSSTQQRTQSALVIAEVALTVVLLASAGLLLRSLARAASVDPGFDATGVLAFDLSLPDASYPTPDERLAFVSALLERLRSEPGVDAAGTAMGIPFAGGAYGEFFARPDSAASQRVTGRLDFVSPEYLQALGVRLVAGRWLTRADNRIDGPRVIVVNQRAVRLFYPDAPAVGETLVIAGNPWTIVGVVNDIVEVRLDAPRRPMGYVPQAFNMSRLSVVVRTHLQPMGLVPSLRDTIAALDPGVALANPRALDQAMDATLRQRRVVLGLIGVFAASALALAAIGLFGVMAYAVTTRRRELGIRIAFGAARGDLIRHVLGRGIRVAGAGLVLGLMAALFTSRLLASELFQVEATDPLVLSGTALLVLSTAVLACLIPARRAAAVEPMTALRQ
jgi:predicted permease